jgi:hypothetical protein
MSVKNKVKDRDERGKIKRKYTGPSSTYWLSHTPRWWVKLFMTRPKRRENKSACVSILKGEDPDGVVFPLGNRKPHKYYW